MRLITISRSFRQRLCLCSLNRTTYRFQLMRITIFLFVFLIVAHVFKGIDLIPSTDRRPRKEAAERSVWKPTCETNHVALIVATSDEAREASFFLKTLFFHRRHPLHLHIFVSEISHLIMKTLMDTWELEQVSYTFYNVIKTKPAFSKKVMKYHIPSFIESSFAPKIAFFENTVRLLDDVRSLWTQNVTRTRVALGLVADHPCTKDQKWCFKDDIIVFDLKEFQLSHLQKSLVKAETEEEIGKILSKSHGDQIFSIPCEWAIALDKPSSLSHCLQRINSIRALVQSDLMPGFSSNPTLELASEHITTVLGSESPVMAPMECGPEFRRGFSDSTDLKLNITDRCAKFRHAGLLKRRTHLHYLGGSGNSQDNSKDLFEISLLTQLTLDRFGALERLLANWVGPAEVLFHLTDSEAMELPMKISGSKSLKGRKEVTYHVVYKRQKHNPINYLRNVLVNGSRVPFQFLVDVDLIPTPTLYKNLKVLVQRFMDKPNQKQILVVPAFQMFQDLKDSTPKNKKQLIPLLSKKTVVGYGMERGWKLGHQPTNYSHWVTSKTTYKIKYANAFEPYVVMRMDSEVRYSESLLERMGDKIAYHRLLNRLGYEYFVIPDDFLIHVPHPTSPGSLVFTKERDYRFCSSQFDEAYIKDLDQRFPVRKS